MSQPNRQFTNQFTTIRKIGKQLITFKSNISYKNYSENLNISPGVFIDFINNGNNYQNAFQKIHFDKFTTNNFAGYHYSKKISQQEMQASPVVYHIWRFIVRYLAPICIVAIFINKVFFS